MYAKLIYLETATQTHRFETRMDDFWELNWNMTVISLSVCLALINKSLKLMAVM